MPRRITTTNTPTRKWLARTAVAVAGWFTAWIASPDGFDQNLKITGVTILLAALTSYLVPNSSPDDFGPQK